MTAKHGTKVSGTRCEACELEAAKMAYAAELGVSEWEAFIDRVPPCDGCRQVAVLLGRGHDYELWCVERNGDTMCALSADHEGPHTNGIEVWNA